MGQLKLHPKRTPHSPSSHSLSHSTHSPISMKLHFPELPSSEVTMCIRHHVTSYLGGSLRNRLIHSECFWVIWVSWWNCHAFSPFFDGDFCIVLPSVNSQIFPSSWRFCPSFACACWQNEWSTFRGTSDIFCFIKGSNALSVFLNSKFACFLFSSLLFFQVFPHSRDP